MSHTNCTTAKGGSVAKLDVLATRYELGVPLWHPADSREMSDESEQLSKPKMQRDAGNMKPAARTIARIRQENWTAFAAALAAVWNIDLRRSQRERAPSGPGTFGHWVWNERKRLGVSRKRLAAVMQRADATVRQIEMSGDGSRPATRERVRAAFHQITTNGADTLGD